jgi:6-pyruvoyltetrahydropterin/6-carboxytetrahydropterin synthase
MRCRLERDYGFEAAHHLPRAPEGHKCRRVHGHSYRLTVVVDGEISPQTGWVLDFAEIDEQVEPLVARLDHRTLNDVEGLENATCELLAAWIWDRLAPSLAGLVEIAVAETDGARCVYRGG